MVYYTFSLWALDTWDSTDYFDVQIDSTSFKGPAITGSMFTSGQLCGRSNSDSSNVRVFGRALHTSSYLTFRVVSYFDQHTLDESFGFRNINILLASTTTTEAICALAVFPTAFTGKCPYIEGQYSGGTCHPNCLSCFGSGTNQCYECNIGFYFDGTNCLGCAPNCDACSGPLSTQCKACALGYLLFDNSRCILTSSCVPPLHITTCNSKCETLCDSNVEFLYWNGTCSVICNPPFTQSTLLTTVKICNYPCALGQYALWTGSCLTGGCVPTTLSLRTESSYNFCDYPCADAMAYLYWNGSCINTCDSPLTPSFISGKGFCSYKCLPAEYLYWDGTCGSCPTPFTHRTEGTKNFCDYPCSTSLYLYWNGSCIGTCNTPFVKQLVGGLNYCNRLCLSSLYLYYNGLCKTTCKSPFSQRIDAGDRYCDLICAESEYMLSTGACIATCTAPLYTITNTTGTFCMLPCDDASPYYYNSIEGCKNYCYGDVTTVQGLYLQCKPTMFYIEPVEIGRLTHYIRYLDIQLPTRLQNIIVRRANNVLSPRVISRMFAKIRAWPSNQILPDAFEKSNLPSSFIANFTDDLILLAILLFTALFTTMLQFFANKFRCPRIEFFLDKLCLITRWNLPIMILASNIGDILFFAAIDLRTYNIASTGALVSLSVCITMLIAVIFLLIAIFLLAREIQSLKSQALQSGSFEKYNKFIHSWRGLQVLFKGYKDDTLFEQCFYGIYCIRMMAPMIIALCVYSIPLLQAILYLAISLLILMYVLIRRPIQDKLSHINLVTIEVTLLVINLSILILVGLHMTKSQNQLAWNFFGDIIITGNFCIDLLSVLFGIYKLGTCLHNAYLSQQGRYTKTETGWIQMLFIPLQQGNFGFEEVDLNSPSTTGISSLRIGPYNSSLVSAKAVLNNEKYANNSSSQLRLDSTVSKPNIRPNESAIDLGQVYNSSLPIEENELFDAFPVNRITQKTNKDSSSDKKTATAAGSFDAFPIARIINKKKGASPKLRPASPMYSGGPTFGSKMDILE